MLMDLEDIWGAEGDSDLGKGRKNQGQDQKGKVKKETLKKYICFFGNWQVCKPV